MAINAIPEDMVVRDAPEQIKGEIQLSAFQEKAFNQQFEQVLNKPTNQERFGVILPIDNVTYSKLTKEMRAGYEEKYDEKSYPGEVYPQGVYPNFTIGNYADSAEQSDQKLKEAAGRAQKVFDSLRMNWQIDKSGSASTRITSEIPLLASLKESYIRTQDPGVKADIHKIFDLLGFHLTFFDQSEVLSDCLIDSEQTTQHYQVVFTKLLADEREAFVAGEPVLAKVNQYRNQLVEYFNKSGLYFPLPQMEDITYAKETGSFTPVGPIVQQEYARGSFKAIVKGRKNPTNIDSQHLTFVAQEPFVLPDMSLEEIDKEAISFLSTVLHESVHFNGKFDDPDIEVGSWQEAANELITDFATLNLITQAGIGKGYREDGSFPEDWFKKTGYNQLVKAAFRLEESGLIKREELVRFGLNQDSQGFIKLLDQRLQQANSQQKQKILDVLDSKTVIGPNQYDLLTAKPNLTTEDLIRGVLDFGQEVGSFYYHQPGAILMNVRDNLPEWKDQTVNQFLDWFNQTDTEIRHDLIRGVIQRHNDAIRK